MARRSSTHDDNPSTLEAAIITAPPLTPVTPTPLSSPLTAATQSTPRSNGSASQLDLEACHECSEVDQYVDANLRTHRVYLPTDIFLNVLLGVPEDLDSNEEFQKVIECVLADPAYLAARAKYGRNVFHEDYIDLRNAASSAIAKAHSPGQLSPDAISVHEKGSPNVLAGAHGQLWHDSKRIALLDNGTTAPYVVLGKDGQDPRDYEERAEETSSYSVDATVKAKRKTQSCTDDYFGRQTKRPRMQDKVTSSESNAVAFPANIPPEDVTKQCARHALKTLSSGFRTHSFVMHIGENELQLLYYDRSVIAVCQPFRMFDTQPKSGPDLDEQRFIAMLILCQQRSSLVQRGIMASLMPDPFLEVYSTYTTAVAEGQPFLFAKRQIRLLVNNKPVLLTLGRILMRQPGIIGRNTCVLEATSPEWKDLELIVKISWPPSSRVAENVFIDRIVKAVADAGNNAAWVLDHIPNLLHSQDFPLSEESLGTRLRDYFEHGSTFAADNRFVYETRVCRVSVHEKLHAVEELTSCHEVAQVLFDVLQVHRWVYDHPRIIHRDLSVGNIMWHRRGERICGVLNDFDLSSFRDFSGTSSKQRTGTRPFMALELHKVDANGHPPRHIYRHDLESLFYITTMLCCAYELQHGTSSSNASLRPVEDSPYLSWFSMTDETLYTKKREMFADDELRPKPHGSFLQFRQWLLHMYGQFNQGILQRTVAKGTAFASRLKRDIATIEEESDEEEEPINRLSASFDETTLGGFVTYDAFFQIMKAFGRRKKGEKDGVKTALDVMYAEAKAE